jgi:hypothetical protein
VKLSVLALDFDGTIASADVVDPAVRGGCCGGGAAGAPVTIAASA